MTLTVLLRHHLAPAADRMSQMAKFDRGLVQRRLGQPVRVADDYVDLPSILRGLRTESADEDSTAAKRSWTERAAMSPFLIFPRPGGLAGDVRSMRAG